jgi:hypothetical protein
MLTVHIVVRCSNLKNCKETLEKTEQAIKDEESRDTVKKR